MRQLVHDQLVSDWKTILVILSELIQTKVPAIRPRIEETTEVKDKTTTVTDGPGITLLRVQAQFFRPDGTARHSVY